MAKFRRCRTRTLVWSMKPRLFPGPTRGFLLTQGWRLPLLIMMPASVRARTRGVYSLASRLLSLFARGIHYENPLFVFCFFFFFANTRVASSSTDNEAGECTSPYEGVYSLASRLLSSFARGIHYENPLFVFCFLVAKYVVL